MNGFVASQDVWTTIRALSAGSSTKKAAVSYVSSDVSLKFGRDDSLVVDASELAIVAGQTSASVIQRAMIRGARVISVPHLHAKVMVLGKTAVVGSANVSHRSERELIEAIMFTEQPALVRRISRWIDDLECTGQIVDDALLQHLLTLESKRPPIQRAYRALAESQIVFFKEVMAGDIEKYYTRSSTAGSGGGARDLRISPAPQFQPLLAQMLSEHGDNPGVTHGSVLSRVGSRRFDVTSVELWPPTNARPNEMRVARFYEVPGWAVHEAFFKRAQQQGRKLFYILEMDIHGTVTAKVLDDRQLLRSNPIIGQHIHELASRSGHRRSIIGAVDVVHNVMVP